MTQENLWVGYARLQKHADSRTLDIRAWATDEALDAILDKIEASEPITSSQTENLIVNRSAKYRQRCALLIMNATVFGLNDVADEESRLLARCRLLECRAQCTRREWQVLVSVGVGNSYNAVANECGVPAATVKTWVRRARLRLAA